MDHIFIILAGTVVMLGVILVLVLALLAASNKLVSTGKVKVLINDDESKSLEVEAGSTLLNTLSSNGLLLPSACGGGGTCGVCRCQVVEGGGDLLPTEEGHISRKESKDHWRLSCQVKVKQDMRIQVPAEIFSIDKWECEVVANDNVATFIKELVLKLPEGENLDFESGGYIQIEVPKYEIDYSSFDVEEEYRGDWDRFDLWDLKAKNGETVVRAYSMANHPAEGNIVMLNIRIASPPPDRAKGGFIMFPRALRRPLFLISNRETRRPSPDRTVNFSFRKPSVRCVISEVAPEWHPYGRTFSIFFTRSRLAARFLIGMARGLCARCFTRISSARSRLSFRTSNSTLPCRILCPRTTGTGTPASSTASSWTTIWASIRPRRTSSITSAVRP